MVAVKRGDMREKKLKTMIICLIIAGIGATIIIKYSNWQTFIGVLILMWASNIERNKQL